MRSGGKVFVLAGVVLGVIAIALAAMAVMGGKEPAKQSAEQPVAKVTVVEVQRDIPAHTLLKAEDLIEVSIPEAAVDPDAVRSAATVLGQSSRIALFKGQRLSTTQLEQPGLSNLIQPGMRAMSLQVNEASLLSGLVQDEDHIDVVFKARINEVRLLGHTMGPTPEDAEFYEFKDGDGFGWVPADLAADFPGYPATGDAGSQISIRDDIKEFQALEPSVKVLVQDLRVLRVVRPGESFDSNGQPVSAPIVEGAAAPDEEQPGYLVLEVNSQQAEMISFIQDDRTTVTNKHTYQVVVRAKGDHQQVNTTGITFEILADNDQYGLPVPGSYTVPEAIPATDDADSPDEG